MTRMEFSVPLDHYELFKRTLFDYYTPEMEDNEGLFMNVVFDASISFAAIRNLASEGVDFVGTWEEYGEGNSAFASFDSVFTEADADYNGDPITSVYDNGDIDCGQLSDARAYWALYVKFREKYMR